MLLCYDRRVKRLGRLSVAGYSESSRRR